MLPFVVSCIMRGTLDGYRTLRIFSSHCRGQDGAGSAVPLTPPLPNRELYAMTADHCVS